MKQAILTKEGKDTGRKAELNQSIFGIEPNGHAIYLDVKRIQAAKRQGTHKAKERGEVRGSTQKIQKQKGSGRARKGDKKAGILRGGGRIHGPRPRTYDLKVNKKTSQLARRSVLSLKQKNKELVVLEDFTLAAPKTKAYYKILQNLSCAEEKTLLILPAAEANIVLSARNLPKAKVIMAHNLNTYALLDAKRLLISEKALETLQKQLS